MRRDVTHGRIRTENGRINPQSAHGMRPQGAACRAGGLRTDGRRPLIGDGDSFRPFLVPRAGSEPPCVENTLLAEIYACPSFTRLLTLAEPRSRQSRGRVSNSPLESSSYLERRSPYSMLGPTSLRMTGGSRGSGNSGLRPGRNQAGRPKYRSETCPKAPARVPGQGAAPEATESGGGHGRRHEPVPPGRA